MISIELTYGDVIELRGRRFYVAGPMTDVENVNKEAFNRAADLLWRRGNAVMNPADNGQYSKQIGDDWIHYIHLGLFQLIQCDYIYMLRDWEKSRGARIEFNLATELKMGIQFEINDNGAEPYEVPWLPKSA